MRGIQPETVLRSHIFSFLSSCSEFTGFVVVNAATYDPSRKIYRKKTGVGHRLGVSDIIGLWNGTFIAIEVKTQTGRISEHQEFFMKDVVAHGGLAFVVRSVDEVVDLVRSIRIAETMNNSDKH